MTDGTTNKGRGGGRGGASRKAPSRKPGARTATTRGKSRRSASGSNAAAQDSTAENAERAVHMAEGAGGKDERVTGEAPPEEAVETAETVEPAQEAARKARPEDAEDATILEDPVESDAEATKAVAEDSAEPSDSEKGAEATPQEAARAAAEAEMAGEAPEQSGESLDIDQLVETTTDKIEEALAEEAGAAATAKANADRDAAAASAAGLAAGVAATAMSGATTSDNGASATPKAGPSGAADRGATTGAGGGSGHGGSGRGGSGGGSDGDGWETRPSATPSWLIPFAAAVLGAVLGGGGAYLALKGDAPDMARLSETYAEKSEVARRLSAVETAASRQVEDISKIYDGRASEIDKRVDALAKSLRTATAESAAAKAAVESQAAEIEEAKTALAALDAETETALENLAAAVNELEAPREAYARDVAELRGLVANLATLVTTGGVKKPAGQGAGQGAESGSAPEENAAPAVGGDALATALATRMALVEAKLEDMAEKFDAPSEAEKALGAQVDAVDRKTTALENGLEALQTEVKDQTARVTGVENALAANDTEAETWRKDIEQAIELQANELLKLDEWNIRADETLLRLTSGMDKAGERLDALEAKLAGVEGTVGDKLEAALAGPTAALADLGTAGEKRAEEVASLASRLGETDTAVKALREEAAAREKTLTEAVKAAEALGERVASLETTAQAFVRGEAAVGVAFASLSQAVNGASPFASELATLTRVAEIETPEALAAHAAAGLPSRIALSARFDEASRKALAASHRAMADDENAGMIDSVLNRMSSIVVVRRIDETEGDQPWAVLSRAEARVDEGDIAAALKELEALPQAGRDAMAAWIADAEARAAAEAALSELRSKLLGVRDGAEPAAPTSNDG